MQNTRLRKMILSALFLALALVLPFITGQIPQIGMRLSPMHIPILICGFVCGWKYGAIVGLISPLLRTLIFSMPPLFPVAIAMAPELLAYGILAGLLYKFFPKKYIYIYVSLILSMLGGRIVWGLAMTIIALISKIGFSFKAFITAGFIDAIPGIILHILVIPPIVFALQKAKLTDN